MPDQYSCFDCHKVTMLLDPKIRKCPVCGSENGQILSEKELTEGFKAGAYFNYDLRTGKPTKKKK
jgi:hypothetical protein